ncbi:MAG: hypothetical protein ABSG37_06670 [Candidatus Limnocylindrales bacterium]|jgi:hypothetical protein
MAVIALAVAVSVAGGCSGGSREPAGNSAVTPGPSPSLPGTPGHFDDGTVSFDYPTDWPVIAGPHSPLIPVIYVLAVLGNGSWSENCQSTSTSSSEAFECGTDLVSFPPGGIVVKVYRYWGGPAPVCRGDVQANETLGGLAIRKTVDGSTTSWELRPPGNEFSQPNNIFVEAHTNDAGQLAKAEALVASFKWSPSAGSGYCTPQPPAGLPAASLGSRLHATGHRPAPFGYDARHE